MAELPYFVKHRDRSGMVIKLACNSVEQVLRRVDELCALGYFIWIEDGDGNLIDENTLRGT
jgi:hypothetical protein